MKKAISACLLLFTTACFAQSKKLDSLLSVLKTAKEDTNKVNLCWNIGAAIIFQNPLKSLPYFKQGIIIAKKLNFYNGIEKCYNGASLSFSYNANYDSALVYIDSAKPYAHKVGNLKRLALVYLNRADICSNLQQFSAALKDCDTAIQYAEKVDNKDGLGRIYSIIGGIYESQSKYPQALKNYDKSIDYFTLSKNRQMIAMQYSEKADVYAQNNEAAKAIPLLKMSIRIGDSLNDTENLAAYTSSLSQSYLINNQFDEAETMAAKALDYVKQAGNMKQEAVIYHVFSSIYAAREKHTEAIAYELKAYNILIIEKDLLREKISAASLAEEYAKIGNTGEAYKYLKISRDLNDSLIKMQFDNETARLQTTLHVTEKDKEIQLLHKNKELQEQKMRQQTTTTIAVIVIALLAIIGGWLLLNRRILKQRMKELELRSKIAADLHDDVGSTLSSIRMYSDIVKKQTQQVGNSAELLDKISSNSKEMIENMSDIVWMIKPGNDDFKNIENRMLNFANELCIPAGINFDFANNIPEDSQQISMEQRRDIYLIFKEAVNNAVKYANCTSINAAISLQGRQLQMRINDNGNGFDSNIIKNGNGLANMQKRTEAHHGKLVINTAPGKGTEIVVKFSV